MGSGSTITTGSTGTNPGGDGASGGLSSGAGGASGAADAGASSQSEGGLLDTVKSYLGVGGAEGEQTGSRSTSGVTGSEAPTSERHQSTGGPMDERQGSAAQQGEERREAREERQEERQEEKQEGDGAVKKTGGGTGNLENKDAIPTAGGERLGEKHWGESKIVPENPKPAEGTASEDGQPDSKRSNDLPRSAPYMLTALQAKPRTTRPGMLVTETMMMARRRAKWTRSSTSCIWARPKYSCRAL